MDRTKVSRLSAVAETTFGTDPDSSGATDTVIRVSKPVGFVSDQLALLETDLATGRNEPTAAEPGADGAGFSFETPLTGLATAAGDGVSPPSADWLDVLLAAVCGTGTAVAGEGVGAGSGGSTLVLDSPATGVTLQTPLPVWETGVASSLTQWRRSGSTTTPFDVDRAWTETPSTAAVLYGTRTYYQPTSDSAKSLTMNVVMDSVSYVLAGCKPKSLKIVAPAGGAVRLQWEIMASAKSAASRASVPALDTFSPAEIKMSLSSVMWGTTSLNVKSVEIDFGLSATWLEATAGANGRAGADTVQMFPTITIDPVYAAAIQTDMRAGTTRRLAIQFGAGTVSGGVLNSCFFFAEAAQVMKADPSDDAGRVRQGITLKCVGEGTFSGSTASNLWMFARA